jgi:hypothetical protein
VNKEGHTSLRPLRGGIGREKARSPEINSSKLNIITSTLNIMKLKIRPRLKLDMKV